MNYNLKDKYNKSKRRNRNNTSQWEYNCGGFALGTFSWYCPAKHETYGHKDEFYGSDWEPFNAKQSYYATYSCIRAMLKDFDDLRLIKSVKELQKDEYAIAFRISETCDDFHYCRRTSNGNWYHKMGNGIIRRTTKEQVFSDIWDFDTGDTYSGQLVLFAKKN